LLFDIEVAGKGSSEGEEIIDSDEAFSEPELPGAILFFSQNRLFLDARIHCREIRILKKPMSLTVT
jgi:hypothetical protein